MACLHARQAYMPTNHIVIFSCHSKAYNHGQIQIQSKCKILQVLTSWSQIQCDSQQRLSFQQCIYFIYASNFLHQANYGKTTLFLNVSVFNVMSTTSSK
jgi:hypothetical protein